MLSRKLFVNLLLLAIAAGLAFLVITTEQTDNRLPLLSNIDTGTISELAIEHNGHRTVIARNGTNWMINQPVTIHANSFRIDSLLKLLHAPVHSSYPGTGDGTGNSTGNGTGNGMGNSTGIKLDNIGIGPRSTSIYFNKARLRFGITNPATGLRYVEFAGQVHTIEDVYFPLLSSHFSTLVGQKLLPPGKHISTLTTPEFRLSGMTNKAGADDSASRQNALLERWHAASAFGIHRYLERENHGTVSITFTDNTAVQFVITDIDPWLILARPGLGIEYHLEKAQASQLLTLQP